MTIIALFFNKITSTQIYEMIAIAVGVTATALAIMAGTGYFTSGASMSETVLTITFEIAAFGGIWGILSIVNSGYITSIPIMGTMIYIALTFMFVLGVFLHIRGYGE